MRVTGAGVCCFSRRPSDGAPVVLIGREKMTVGWRQGSNRWSGFSGKLESSESVAQGAAREFVEESLGVVPLSLEMRVPVAIVIVGNELEKCEDLLEVVTRARSDGEDCTHITFLKHIPYGPYPEEFARVRALLLRCDECFKSFHRRRKQADWLPRVIFPGYRISHFLTVVMAEALPNGNAVRIGAWDSGACALETFEFELSRQAVEDAKGVYSNWGAVRDFVSQLPAEILKHPALQLLRAGGRIVSAHVNKGFLEKSEIKWWSLEELDFTCIAAPDNFRHFFQETRLAMATRVEAMLLGKGH